MAFTKTKRKLRSAARRFEEAKMIARTLKSNRQPVLVHLVPIRRCNLACTYCNEFDSFSEPVATQEMLRRVDLLAALRSESIHLSGGEPLLHPGLEEIIARIHQHGIFSGLLTNGLLLTRERIKQLNAAGLDYLQISIDNLVPDDVSVKSLKALDKKLQWLSELAEFDVSINTVLGGALRSPGDAVTILNRAKELELKSTVGIIHDNSGGLLSLSEEQRKAYEQVMETRKRSFLDFAYYNQFQKNLVQGMPNEWHCRAGSRYLYVCEDGLVHYCSQQRGAPAIPLEKYTQEDLDREYSSVKPCAPFCTISCVHRVSMIDQVRENPQEALARFFPAQREPGSAPMPLLVKFLAWLFLGKSPADKRLLKTAVRKLLRV